MRYLLFTLALLIAGRLNAQLNLRTLHSSDSASVSRELQVQGWKTLDVSRALEAEIKPVFDSGIAPVDSGTYLVADAISLDKDLNNAFILSRTESLKKLIMLAVSDLKKKVNADINAGIIPNNYSLELMQSIEKASAQLQRNILDADILACIYIREGAMYKVQVVTGIKFSTIAELLIASITEGSSADPLLAKVLKDYFRDMNTWAGATKIHID
jgi:hypothetical protein